MEMKIFNQQNSSDKYIFYILKRTSLSLCVGFQVTKYGYPFRIPGIINTHTFYTYTRYQDFSNA